MALHPGQGGFTRKSRPTIVKTKILMLGACSALLLAVAAPSAGASGLADHVDPFAGTRPGPGTFGGGHNFPGATVPFGMVQWSPDTTPADRTAPVATTTATTTSRASASPTSAAPAARSTATFPSCRRPSRSNPRRPRRGPRSTAISSRASPTPASAPGPGYYSVRLNPVDGAAIDTELTATTRTGMARFTFPRARTPAS